MMNAESAGSPLFDDLARIHRIITNSLEALTRLTGSISPQSLADNKYRSGFVDYLTSMSTFVHGHHMNEDDLFFPKMKAGVPNAPYDALSEHHEQMKTHLTELDGTMIPSLRGQSYVADTIKSLGEWAEEMLQLWTAHRDLEEVSFSAEKMNEGLDLEEQHQLTKEIQANGRSHSKPFGKIVPFLLFNLPPEERPGLLPWVVARILVPIVWRFSWQSMTPFFAYPPK
jgi:hemerythrin-like domain-containing protein